MPQSVEQFSEVVVDENRESGWFGWGNEVKREMSSYTYGLGAEDAIDDVEGE